MPWGLPGLICLVDTVLKTLLPSPGYPAWPPGPQLSGCPRPLVVPAFSAQHCDVGAFWSLISILCWGHGLSDYWMGFMCICRCSWVTCAQVEDLASLGACSLPAQGTPRTITKASQSSKVFHLNLGPAYTASLPRDALSDLGVAICWCLVIAVRSHSPTFI